MNQYPPAFFEPIINKTLTKIIQSTLGVNGEEDISELESDTESDFDGSKDGD